MTDTPAGTTWDLLVRRDDVSATTIERLERPELAAGRVRLAVERFGVSANNVTYAVGGESSPLRWLDNFPAAEGFVRVPVWGFATISESRHPEHPAGTRVFGYLPMSTDVDVTPQPFDGGFLDASAHREGIPASYRRLVVVGGPEELDGLRTSVRAVFPASFLLADVVDQQAERVGGPVTVLFTSASSKTALGAAHVLRERGRATTHGLTSPANTDFVRRTGLFDATGSYEDLPDLAPGAPVVLLDFSGRRSLLSAIHERYGESILLHQTVGGTAREARVHDLALPGPAPVLFNAPPLLAGYLERLGERRFTDLLHGAEAGFLEVAQRFLTVRDSVGGDAAAQVWARALAGGIPPDTVEVVHPRGSSSQAARGHSAAS